MPAIFRYFSLDKNKQPLSAISHKVNFQITIFKQFRVSLFQKSMIGLDMKYFKFHHLSSCKMVWAMMVFIIFTIP